METVLLGTRARVLPVSGAPALSSDCSSMPQTPDPGRLPRRAHGPAALVPSLPGRPSRVTFLQDSEAFLVDRPTHGDSPGDTQMCHVTCFLRVSITNCLFLAQVDAGDRCTEPSRGNVPQQRTCQSSRGPPGPCWPPWRSLVLQGQRDTAGRRTAPGWDSRHGCSCAPVLVTRPPWKCKVVSWAHSSWTTCASRSALWLFGAPFLPQTSSGHAGLTMSALVSSRRAFKKHAFGDTSQAEVSALQSDKPGGQIGRGRTIQSEHLSGLTRVLGEVICASKSSLNNSSVLGSFGKMSRETFRFAVI
ncbi:uncharacterized protein LOC120619227 [Pteropus medius]|uniref:uncharacterized protein LOC120619227 n=1 Tax=Pteropus vampyrus TaxID=132908 RepID=UPI00196A2D32|nr:uncharacterized protein LOC120619227 [Pteropus giganteus]